MEIERKKTGRFRPCIGVVQGKLVLIWRAKRTQGRKGRGEELHRSRLLKRHFKVLMHIDKAKSTPALDPEFDNQACSMKDQGREVKEVRWMILLRRK